MSAEDSIHSGNLGNRNNICATTVMSNHETTPMPRIALITGITGQTGGYLAVLLKEINMIQGEPGYFVVGVSRSVEHASKSPHYIVLKELGVRFEYGNLGDVAFCKRLLQRWQPDEIYHLAGPSSSKQQEHATLQTVINTGLTTCILLECMHEIVPKARFFHANSHEIFGFTEKKDNSKSDSPTLLPWTMRSSAKVHNGVHYVHERELQNNTLCYSPYVLGKMTSLNALRYYRSCKGIFAVTGFLFPHDSSSRKDDAESIIHTIAKAAASIQAGTQHVLCLNDLNAEQDWSHAKDIAKGIFASLQAKSPIDYIFGSQELHTVEDICRIAFRDCGLSYFENVLLCGEKNQNARAERNAKVADTSTANLALNWKTIISFNNLVHEIVTTASPKMAKSETQDNTSSSSSLNTTKPFYKRSWSYGDADYPVLQNCVRHSEQNNDGCVVSGKFYKVGDETKSALHRFSFQCICYASSYDNPTTFKKVSGPCLYASLRDVLKLDRQQGLYLQKNGGIYRVLYRNVLWTHPKIDGSDELTQEEGHVREHLYPFGKSIVWQPSLLFEEPQNFRLIPEDVTTPSIFMKWCASLGLKFHLQQDNSDFVHI